MFRIPNFIGQINYLRNTVTSNPQVVSDVAPTFLEQISAQDLLEQYMDSLSNQNKINVVQKNSQSSSIKK